jgi:hypothetical protein
MNILKIAIKDRRHYWKFFAIVNDWSLFKIKTLAFMNKTACREYFRKIESLYNITKAF